MELDEIDICEKIRNNPLVLTKFTSEEKQALLARINEILGIKILTRHLPYAGDDND